MVKVKIKEISERKARLLIEGTRPYFPNSLRRILVAEVPKLAVHDVVLYDNNSGLFDEMIAHRVGLLPVPTDLNALVFRSECSCSDQGCANCTVRYTLSKEGPGVVTAADLQPDNPELGIADPEIPIVELLKGQRLILEAEAILGRGREHAKWQPCHGAGYRYAPLVKPTDANVKALQEAAKLASKHDQELASQGKAGLFDEDGIVTVSDGCLGLAQEAGVEVGIDDTRFQFQFETDGSLTAKQALSSALELMRKRLSEFEEKASKLKATVEPEATV